LCGVVTASPPIPSVRIAATAAAPLPGATSNATIRQSTPAASKAALCSAGDNECRTGDPITAATRVAPVIGPPVINSPVIN
jgi:hypothetical protein